MCMESKQGMTPTGGKELYSGTMGTNQGRGAANFRSMGGSVAPVSASPSASSILPLDQPKPVSGASIVGYAPVKPYGERLLDDALDINKFARPSTGTRLTEEERAVLEKNVAENEARKAMIPESIKKEYRKSVGESMLDEALNASKAPSGFAGYNVPEAVKNPSRKIRYGVQGRLNDITDRIENLKRQGGSQELIDDLQNQYNSIVSQYQR